MDEVDAKEPITEVAASPPSANESNSFAFMTVFQAASDITFGLASASLQIAGATGIATTNAIQRAATYFVEEIIPAGPVVSGVAGHQTKVLKDRIRSAVFSDAIPMPNIQPTLEIQNFDDGRVDPLAAMPPLRAGEAVKFFRSPDDRFAYRYYEHIPGKITPWTNTFVLYPGKSAPMEMYMPLLQLLADEGHVVFCIDLLSQGMAPRLTSNTQKVHVPHFGMYQKQRNDFEELIVAPHRTGIYTEINNSTSGHISLLQDDSDTIPDCKIISACMVEPLALRKIGLLKLAQLGRSDEYLGYPKKGDSTDAADFLDPAKRDKFLQGNRYTRNQQGIGRAVHEILLKNPLLTADNVTNAWYLAMAASVKRLYAQAPRKYGRVIKAIFAEDDGRVNNRATRDFLASHVIGAAQRRDDRSLLEFVIPEEHGFLELGTEHVVRHVGDIALRSPRELQNLQPLTREQTTTRLQPSTPASTLTAA